MNLKFKHLLIILTVSLFSFTSRAAFIVPPAPLTVDAGESFTVDVNLQLDSTETLTGFGFDLDLTDAANIVFDSVDFPTWLVEDSFGQISGAVDFLSPAISGPDTVTIASLNFTAGAAGSSVIDFTGSDGGFFLGLFFDDFSYQDIDTSFNVTVNAVPETGTASLAALAMVMAFWRRKTKVSHA